MAHINEYSEVVGQDIIDELYLLSGKLAGKAVQNINSTSVGGGVAEILIRMVPLLKDLNINAHWDVIKGDEKFYNITKKMHNALHGVEVEITSEELDYFTAVNRANADEMPLYGDYLFIHDPQPIGLARKKSDIGKKWAWRCHIDFTRPQERVWDFLKTHIEMYDAMVVSAPSFVRDVKVPQYLISPSIDPLSDKNRDLEASFIDETLARFGIDRERPVVTQISRFDYLKDPVGVIAVYKKVKKHTDCQLVLAGGGATDDPEGAKVLEEVKCAADGDPDIHIIFLPPGSDLEINALQRASTVVLQKSLKEGFGLTVSEALWKSKPVIASAVGGIPLQITHQYSGLLSYSIDGTAYYLKQLLQEPDYARQLGKNGKEHIRNNFLITRHIRDYLMLFLSLDHPEDLVRL